jgi:hypothetical protein
LADQLLQTKGIERTSQAFREELVRVAERLRTNPNFLAAVMSNESGFDPSATNPVGGATGLIQWMPTIAPVFGTTTDELRCMTDFEQLAYVEKFYRGHAGNIDSAGTAYMLTFLPAFAHKPDDFVLGEKDSTEVLYGSTTKGKLYTQNRGFDREGKGYFDVGDVKAKAEGTYRAAVSRGPLVEEGTPHPKEDPAVPSPRSIPPQSSPSLEPEGISLPSPSSWSEAQPLPTLRFGDTGEAVEHWQNHIGVVADGFFGHLTDAATKAWQEEHGLVADGIVGPKTWGAT